MTERMDPYMQSLEEAYVSYVGQWHMGARHLGHTWYKVAFISKLFVRNKSN